MPVPGFSHISIQEINLLFFKVDLSILFLTHSIGSSILETYISVYELQGGRTTLASDWGQIKKTKVSGHFEKWNVGRGGITL